MHRLLTIAGTLAAMAIAMAGPVRAQDAAVASDSGSLRNWRIGSLPFNVASPARPERLADIHEKYRIGSSLLPWLEPFGSVKTWVGTSALVGGATASLGGVLVDIPLGSFVFTPSFGAGVVPGLDRDSRNGYEIRSQLELGYQFGDHSRVTLGYSRIAGSVTTPDKSTDTKNNVFGFTYRMPFGSLVGP